MGEKSSESGFELRVGNRTGALGLLYSLRILLHVFCVLKALKLGEVAFRGFASLTSICLGHPFGAEVVLGVALHDELGRRRVHVSHESVPAVDASALTLHRQTNVLNGPELLEVCLLYTSPSPRDS